MFAIIDSNKKLFLINGIDIVSLGIILKSQNTIHANNKNNIGEEECL